MGVLGRVGAFILLGLLPCICAQAEDVVNDLSAVQFMDHYKGPDQGKELLKQNGFVVVQRFYHRISGPYADMEIPHYVTTDSVYNTFHIIFEDLLKEVEADCAGQVLEITQKTRESLKALPPDGVTKILVADPDTKALADQYFQVAECLLSDKDMPADIPVAARDELALIMAAAGPAPSPLFKYETDYSQFKPRGFYTGSKTLERYFRAMSWYGNMAFRVVDERESMAALLIAQSLNGNEELRSAWAKIDGLYSYLLAPSDDLTPLDYAAILPFLSANRSTEEAWVVFGQAAATLRDPRINSMILTPDRMPDWQKLSKGMRFFGKHYLPDSEAFMNLTDPAVPGRGFPSGLDIMAVNGSARAAELAEQGPDTKNPAYELGIAKSKEAFGELKNASRPTHYAQFLNLLNTINAPASPEAPAFAKTPAYTDKNLMTALSAWASMRHAWALHAKQSVMYLGLSESKPVVGYVEPNLAFFEAMHNLIARTKESFAGFKGVDRSVDELDRIVLRLTEMVKKEIAGDSLTEDDAAFLRYYGSNVSTLQGFHSDPLVDENQPLMALISDVHTEMQSQECLEEGLGGAMPIYVIVERGGTQELMIGGVCSYYEFRQPIADRLTDETWRDRWSTGKLPALPAWSSTFVAGQFGVEAIIERIKMGEKPDEAYFINDPKFYDFLESAILPSSPLYEAQGYYWLTSLAAAKLGRTLAPFFIEQIRTGNTKRHDDGRPDAASAAGDAFGQIVSAEDLPALKEIMLAGDKERSRAAEICLCGLKSDALADFLLPLFATTEEPGARQGYMRMIGNNVSKDVTPRIVDLWKQGDIVTKVLTANALGSIWAPKKRFPEYGMFKGLRPSYRASEAQQAIWEAEVKNLVLDTLQQGQSTEAQKAIEAIQYYGVRWDDLLSLAGTLTLEEAIPILKNAVVEDRGAEGALEGLISMDTERSTETLLDLTRTGQNDRFCEMRAALSRVRTPGGIPRLRELLSDKRETCSDHHRTCDFMTVVLTNIFPDGPGFIRAVVTPLAGYDAKVEEWQAYLDKKYPTGK